MLDDALLELVGSALKPLGARAEGGEEYRSPALDVLGYFSRRVKLSWVPVLGRGLSVAMVVRQPVDLSLGGDGARMLVERLTMALNARYPPVRGLSIGLTGVVLGPEPIGPEDDEGLRKAIEAPARSRVVPLGLFRLNLGQEAMAMALARGPDGLFPEPEVLADALTPHFRRFVPLIGI